MKVSEFYELLHKFSRHSVWKNCEGWIRTQVKYNHREVQFCPLTYVAYKLTGKMLEQAEYVEAGHVLGLRNRDINLIADASDNKTVGQRVRNKLLKAVNLLGGNC